MTDPRTATVGLALALGIAFAAFIPAWGLVVWMARSPSPPSRWLAEGRWSKAIAWLACGVTAIAVAEVGWISVYHDLVGPSRRTEQRVVYGAAMAMHVLWIAALAWVEKKRRRERDSTAEATEQN